MEIIENIFDKDMKLESDLISKKVCFLDIETTGLNKNTETIYLIGLAYYDNDLEKWNIVQLFAEELKEEIDIVLEAHKILSDFDVIINYNGTSFDIPFLNSKLKFYKTNKEIEIDKSLDLYRVMQSNKNIFHLKNYKLKTIEEFLGIHREDKLTGKECIQFYFDYLVTKDLELKNSILLHNYEDLYYLLDVVKIIDIFNEMKSFHIRYKGNDNHFLIEGLTLNKDYLFIRGIVENNHVGNIMYYEDYYKIIIGKDNRFEVSLEVKEGMVTPTNRCLFINRETFNLKNKPYWSNEFQIPKGIILLCVDKDYYIENIKMVIKTLILGILIN